MQLFVKVGLKAMRQVDTHFFYSMVFVCACLFVCFCFVTRLDEPFNLLRRSLLVLTHLQDQSPFGTRTPISSLKTNSVNSSGMRKSFDTSPEDSSSHILNGNGASPAGTSRLDNSVIFGGQTLESRQVHRSIFRTSSLPETGLLNDHAGAKEPEAAPSADLLGGRYERFSFLLNSSSSSLPGAEDTKSRMSRSPQASISSPPSNSPTRLLSPTGSIDLHRPFAASESPLSLPMGLGMGLGTGRVSAPILQRSLSADGNAGVQQTSLFNSVPAGPQFQSKEPEPEKNIMSKYRAFPDAYVSMIITLAFSSSLLLSLLSQTYNTNNYKY